MSNLTPQQIQQLASQASSALIRQHLEDPKAKFRDKPSSPAIKDFEKTSTEIGKVAERMVRGFKDMLSIPKTVEQAFKELSEELKDDTREYSDSINKMTKATLDYVKNNKGNIKNLKDQSKAIFETSKRLDTFMSDLSNIKDLERQQQKIIDDLKKKQETKQAKIDAKTNSGMEWNRLLKDMTKLGEQQKNLEKIIQEYKGKADPASAGVSDDLAKMVAEFQEMISHDRDAQDHFQPLIEDINKIVDKIKDNGDKDLIISEEEKKTLKHMSTILEERNTALEAGVNRLTTTMVDNSKRFESIFKGIISLSGTLAKTSFGAFGAQGRAGLMGEFMPKLGEAWNLGISPEELYSIMAENKMSLGMYYGKDNLSTAIDDDAVMRAAQKSQLVLGLVGKDAIEQHLRNVESQLYMGTYDRNATPEDRNAQSQKLSESLAYYANMNRVDAQKYATQFTEDLRGGMLNPMITRLKQQGTTSENMQDTLQQSYGVLRAQLKHLGYADDYYKYMMQQDMIARNKDLVGAIMGQVGVDVMMTQLESMGIKTTAKDRDLFKRLEIAGSFQGMGATKEEMERMQFLQASVYRKGNEYIGATQDRSRSPEGIIAAYSDYLLFNTFGQRFNTVGFNQEAVETAGNARIASETIAAASKYDASGNLLYSPVLSLDDASNKAATSVNSLNSALELLFNIAKGTLGNPFGATAAGIGGFALDTAETAIGGYAAMKMIQGGGIMKLLSGSKWGKLLLAGTTIATAVGGMSYLSSSASESGATGAGSVGSQPNTQDPFYRDLLGMPIETQQGTFNINSAILNIGSFSGDNPGAVTMGSSPAMLTPATVAPIMRDVVEQQNKESERSKLESTGLISNITASILGSSAYAKYATKATGMFGKAARFGKGLGVGALAGLVTETAVEGYNRDTLDYATLLGVQKSSADKTGSGFLNMMLGYEDDDWGITTFIKDLGIRTAGLSTELALNAANIPNDLTLGYFSDTLGVKSVAERVTEIERANLTKSVEEKKKALMVDSSGNITDEETPLSMLSPMDIAQFVKKVSEFMDGINSGVGKAAQALKTRNDKEDERDQLGRMTSGDIVSAYNQANQSAVQKANNNINRYKTRAT